MEAIRNADKLDVKQKQENEEKQLNKMAKKDLFATDDYDEPSSTDDLLHGYATPSVDEESSMMIMILQIGIQHFVIHIIGINPNDTRLNEANKYNRENNISSATHIPRIDRINMWNFIVGKLTHILFVLVFLMAIHQTHGVPAK